MVWKGDKSSALTGNKDIMGSLCLGTFLLGVVEVNSRISTPSRVTTGAFASRSLDSPDYVRSANCAW